MKQTFQYFFSSRLAWLGIGLGLSVIFDIVNAHTGELIVVKKEGEGASFIIQFPVKYTA